MTLWKQLSTFISGSGDKKSAGNKHDPFSIASLEPLEYSLNAAGRVSLAFVQKLHGKLDKRSFCTYLQCPVLIGSALHEGRVTAPTVSERARRKTQLFIPKDIIEASNTSSDSLQQAIYPLLLTQKKLKSNTPEILTIGRDTDCDIVMPDTAISERHARLYVQKGNYTLQDTYSTNGTAVNGVPIKNEPMPLVDGCSIQFARYEFQFLSPAALYDFLTPA